MPHYKDSNNQLYFLESPDYVYVLPAGCIEISEDEAQAIRAADRAKLPNPRIGEIRGLLAELDMKKIRPMATGDTEFLATLNAQSDALRAELNGLTQ